MVLLQVSLMDFVLGISNDELHFSVIEGVQMEGESDVYRSVIDDIHFLAIQRGEMEDESGVT